MKYFIMKYFLLKLLYHKVSLKPFFFKCSCVLCLKTGIYSVAKPAANVHLKGGKKANSQTHFNQPRREIENDMKV